MNKIEKIIYDSVKSMPWLKYLIRNIYQSVFDLMPRQREYTIASVDFKENYFFGFHDVSPFSIDNSKLLANKLSIPLQMPTPQDKLSIGYFKIYQGKLGEYIELDESYAWNYHKGCRLQWLDSDKIIFNSSIDKQLVSKVIDVNSLNENIIDYPIDTVSNNGKTATSFSYERLHQLMPGYGYPFEDDGFLKVKAPKETGIFLIDLIENKRKLLISLKDLIEDIDDIPEINNYHHYVTHSEFSKDDRFISFMHRWTGSDIRERQTRLIIYDLVEDNFCSLPTQGMVSHYVWNEKNQILAYCNIDGLDCHTLFDVPNINKYKTIEPEVLNSDGHQSFINDNEFITDTYPDRRRMTKLFKVNINQQKVQLLASIYSPKKFQTRNFKKHIACDFHPRVSPDKKYVCFDAIRNDRRSICLMPISKVEAS